MVAIASAFSVFPGGSLAKNAVDALPVELREKARDAMIEELSRQLVDFFYQVTKSYRFVPTTGQMQVVWEVRNGEVGLHVVMRGNLASTEHTTVTYPIANELIAKYLSAKVRD